MYLTYDVKLAESAQASWERIPATIQTQILDFLRHHTVPDGAPNPLQANIPIPNEPRVRQLKIENFRVIYLIDGSIRMVLTVLTDREFHQLRGE